MILDTLNIEQREAVVYPNGPLLVLSGAGTGKTRVLTARFAYLVEKKGVNPQTIMAVTFTNKAANEIKNRVSNELNLSIISHWIGTFHAIFSKFLRKHSSKVGLKSNFTILDIEDQKKLVKQVVSFLKLDNDLSENIILSEIQNLKDEIILSNDNKEVLRHSSIKNIDMIYSLYQERLLEINSVDFGDLLLHSYNILKNNPEILMSYKTFISHILIDEFQDTNVIQYELIKLLLDDEKNIFCVGDDDQSIYAWRGAKVENILNFPEEFKAPVIRLTKNYRSNNSILSAASEIIGHNKNRLGKNLECANKQLENNKIILQSFYSQEEESLWIADSISNQISKNEVSFSILVRLTAQMRSIEDKLIKYALPYQIIGGPRFFERKEIKDIIAYLKLAHSNDSDLSFERIINLPRRGIGEQTLNLIIQNSRDKKINFLNSSRELLESKSFPQAVSTKISVFLTLIDKCKDLVNKTNLEDLGIFIIEESGYMKMLEIEKNTKKKLENETRIENLKELVNAMSEFTNLDEFLEHVGLVNENIKNTEKNNITLMTLHGAKGLEFDHVFLPGWEEGIFPSARALEEKGQKSLEEERRLAYVGITRAKTNLYLSYATSRYTYGVNNFSIPSRFLSEMNSSVFNSSISNEGSIKSKVKYIDDGSLSPGKKRMLEFLKKHK
ncbi:MAG: UvrD-helicase domain-containing protein [Alphaproteobacteria bacterium]|nr:UvrD-helicase domain-containing protein [Alphaproteobacteria bacterium]